MTQLAAAQLPQTELSSVFPPGGQAGTEVLVRLNGKDIDGATQLVFSHPGITATQVMEPPSEFLPKPRPRSGEFQAKIDGSVSAGRYDVRAAGRFGLSNPRTFSVSTGPETVLPSSDNRRENPFRITSETAVSAVARADARDYYIFSAKAGQSILIQVWAERIDSRMDAALAVYGPGGQRLARALEGRTSDPVLRFVAPRDGDYLVEVWDFVYRGGGDYFYRLALSPRPHIEAVFPPAAEPGTRQMFTIYGHNLPDSQLLLNVTGVGPVEQARVAIDVPALPEEGPVEPPAGLRLSPSGATLDGTVYRLPAPAGDSNSVLIGYATAPTIIERDDNSSPASAQKVNVPCEYLGQFYPQGDQDWVEFSARKGQAFWIEVVSNRLGAPTDPLLRVRKKVTGADGKEQISELNLLDDVDGARNSKELRLFDTGSSDPVFQLRVDQDAAYQLNVRDLYNTSRGDPRFVYRLIVRDAQPDFALVAFPEPPRQNDQRVANPSGLSILPGGTALLRVRLLPRDGFAGQVEVKAADLPPGVTAWPLTLSNQASEGQLVFHAEQGAPHETKSVRIIGRATAGDTHIVRTARTGTIVWGTNNVDQTPTAARLTDDLVVSVADDEQTPLTVRIGDEQPAETSFGGKLEIPIQLTRAAGFTSEIELAAETLPKGIKVDNTKVTGDQGKLTLSITDNQLAPGNYTFPLAAKIKAKHARNPQAIEFVEEELAFVKQVLEQRTQHMNQMTTQRDAANKAMADSADTLAQAQQQQAAATQTAVAAIAAQKQAVQALQQALEAAERDAANVQAFGAIAQAEKTVAELAQRRQEAAAQIAAASSLFEQAAMGVKTVEEQRAAAEKDLADAQQSQKRAEEQMAAAEKRLTDTKNANQPKDVEFWVYSTPVRIQMKKTPVEVFTPQTELQVASGNSIQVPVSIRRRYGFDGDVTLKLFLPNGPPEINTTAAALGSGQSNAKLVVSAGQDVKEGTYPADLETIVTFNGVQSSDKQRLAIKVAVPQNEGN